MGGASSAAVARAGSGAGGSLESDGCASRPVASGSSASASACGLPSALAVARPSRRSAAAVPDAACPRRGRALERTDSMAASSLLPPAGAREGSAVKTSARPVSRPSSPLSSSASSSTNRSTTRERATTSTSSRLSSTRVSPSRMTRLRRSCRIVTSSISAASPASSRTSERASDAGHSSGPAVRSAGPSSSSRRSDPPGPSVRAVDFTETMVPRPDCRRRTANPDLARAPSAVST